MKLEDFVSETLLAVIAGVKKAQGPAAQAGARINASRSSSELAQLVAFEVQVTTVEGTTTEGKLGVFVGPIGAGTRGQSEASSQSVGTIKFTVPVELPIQPRS